MTHFGYTVHTAQDLPRSVRSITDLRNRRIYVKHEQLGMHTPRTILLQTLGHLALGHGKPRDFADFLRQRTEANYFAAAVLVPEKAAAVYLQEAKADAGAVGGGPARRVRRLLRDGRAPLHQPGHPPPRPGLPLRRNDAGGIIYKAYENDGIVFPADEQGAIEGQRMCLQWSGRQVFTSPDRFSVFYQYSDSPTGTYFCVAHVDPSRERDFAITLGVPFKESRWFRGRETTNRTRSSCPNGDCCRRPPTDAGRTLGGVRLAVGPRATPTCWPPCRPARSPAWTRRMSTRSWSGTRS